MDRKHYTRRIYRPTSRRLFIDSITTTARPVATRQRSAPPAPKPEPVKIPKRLPLQIHKKQFAPPAAKPRRWWRRLQTPLVICGAAIVGLGIQDEAVGMVIVSIYGLCAAWFRIPSRTTFELAAFSVIGVVCLLLFRPDLELAGTFTTYTFLLLVTGVITLAMESRPFRRRKKGRLRRAEQQVARK